MKCDEASTAEEVSGKSLRYVCRTPEEDHRRDLSSRKEKREEKRHLQRWAARTLKLSPPSLVSQNSDGKPDYAETHTIESLSYQFLSQQLLILATFLMQRPGLWFSKSVLLLFVGGRRCRHGSAGGMIQIEYPIIIGFSVLLKIAQSTDTRSRR
jgi:hypothetical protein